MTSASVHIFTGRFPCARDLSECRQIHDEHQHLPMTNSSVQAFPKAKSLQTKVDLLINNRKWTFVITEFNCSRMASTYLLMCKCPDCFKYFRSLVKKKLSA